ncbi:MAG: hypothetical protein ACXVXC_05795 [Nocardioidaceae bacterium]
MTFDKPPLDLLNAWAQRHAWQARRDGLPHRVDVSLEVACAERFVPEYLAQARVTDPNRARACEAVMPALFTWCAQPEDAEPFDRRLAEAFWVLPQDEDEEMWTPELGGFADEAFDVIGAACNAPLKPKFRDTASSEAFRFVQFRRAEPVLRAAYRHLEPLDDGIHPLLDGTHFRMAEIAVQEAALRLAEQRQTALTAADAWALEAGSGELLARHGAELADLYREFLEARVEEYVDHWNPAASRGAAVLLVECAKRTNDDQARRHFHDRAREQAKRIGAADLVAYVETHG